MTNLNNWEYITLVKIINYRKKIILPILILYSILILKKMVKENDFDENILPAITHIKYSNNELVW